MSDFHNSFTESDNLSAFDSFRHWQAEASESIDDYTLRKRKAELYALVRKVIREELTPEQQELVRLHWYEGKRISNIAAENNIERSHINREIKKINDIIYERLKYAIEYRYGKSFSDESMLVIKTNRYACCPVEGRSISERLRQLRVSNSFTEKDIEEATGISPQRLMLIETKGEKTTVDELKKLTKLFSTTSDYIIFGKSSLMRGVV